MENIKSYVQQNKDRFINELIELLKIPSISADSAYSQDVLNTADAIKIALDLKIKPTIIEKTIPKIFFEGRLQYIKKGKLRRFVHKNEKIILDGAHSNTSGKNLYNYLKTIKLPIYCIWGMQKNKFPNEFLKNFKGIFKKIITVKIPNEKNSCTSEELKQIEEIYEILFHKL